MEMYDATGLGLMARMLRVWGFQVDRDPTCEPVTNRWVCWFIAISGWINLCLACPSIFIILSYNEGSLKVENMSIVITVIIMGYVSTILSYILILRVATHYCILLRSLATAIAHISDDSFRQKTISGIRRTFFILMLPLAASLIGIFYSQIKGQFWFKSHNDSVDATPFTYKIVNVLSFSGNCVWLVTCCAFYAFNNCVLVVVCKALIALVHYHLPEQESETDVWTQSWRSQPKDINRKLVLHQKLSRLVKKSDRVFSYFLLLSLCAELLIGVAYVKMLTMSGGRFSFSAHNHLIQIFILVVKACVCGNVNDKLRASLVMDQHPQSVDDYDYCSTRQVNYIFYVNEQQLNRAEFTYGGFFPVRKTFIFTVAGTIFTYALVLMSMSDSQQST